MTTKKVLLIVSGLVFGLVLLVGLFAGAIAGVAVYAVGHSEAAETAKTFLRNNERLKNEIGEVRDFGWLVTGGVNTHNADGDATLNLKAIGEKGSVNTGVSLFYKNGRQWRVAGATYKNGQGRIIELLDKYEAEESESSVAPVSR